MKGRDYPIVWIVLAASGLGTLFASRATWITGKDSGGIAVDYTGVDVSPASFACAIIVMAVAVIILISGRWVRLASGIIALIAGTVIAVFSVGNMIVGGFSTTTTIIDASATPWGWIASLLGVLSAVAGLIVAIRSSSWPTFSTRYERGDRTPRDAWEALDRGVDPTVDQ